MKVDAVAEAELGGEFAERDELRPEPARSNCQSVHRERGGVVASSSARARRSQSMRLFASMRQTESRRSGPPGGMGRMRKRLSDVVRPPMRARWASMWKSRRHSARRNWLVTMVLPPLERPWAMMRLETAMRRQPGRVRVAASLKSEGVSCMRVWKPRTPASVACSAA